MRKGKPVVILSVLVLWIWIMPAFSADVAKIGVVNFQRIMEVSSAGKASQAEMTRQAEKRKTDLQQRRNELKEFQQNMEREAMVMSREMREEKERDFRIRVNDFKSLEKKYNQELADLNKTLVKQMQVDIIGLVEQLGKSEGYLMIVEKLEGGVIYTPQTIDITDQVIKIYNEQFAQKSTKVKP